MVIVENQSANKDFVGYRVELLSHAMGEQWKGREKNLFLVGENC